MRDDAATMQLIRHAEDARQVFKQACIRRRKRGAPNGAVSNGAERTDQGTQHENR